MSKIISLAAHRERKRNEEQAELAAARGAPYIKDSEIWSKNYSEFGSVLFAILKLKAILDHNLPFNEEWKYYLLNLLEAAYESENGAKEPLVEAAYTLKAYLVEESNVVNKREMGIGLVLLELICKANRQRNAPRPQNPLSI